FDRHLNNSGSLKLHVRGLPVKEYPLNRTHNKVFDPKIVEGEIELNLSPALPPGDYPCVLTSQTKTDYSRNPEAVEAAKGRLALVKTFIDEQTSVSARALETQQAA